MSRINDIREEIGENNGLWVSDYSPGDGLTRYRFFNEPGNKYFGPGDGIYTALGRGDALTYVAGFHAGRHSRGNYPTKRGV